MPRQELINRPHYLDWLLHWKDKDVIKVVTGMRRCGKSSLLRMFRDRLQQEGVADERIIAINFESLDEPHPSDYQELYDSIVARLRPGTTTYVFLDEIQHVNHFEKAVDGLYVRDDVDLYITGSNANLLSSELATLLTGRYVEITMQPLSFAEYRDAQRLYHPAATGSTSDETLFDRYLTYGGLPYAAQIDDDNDIADYLGGVFNTILVQDIARRNPRMDTRAFTDVAAFLADNVGNAVSLKSVAGSLKASGRNISPTTVGAYIDAMIRNYLLYRARRYDLQGKAWLSTEEKCYLGDLGFRFWLLGKGQGDLGHRMENAVYLELLRRYHTVNIGKLRNLEIDFVATNADGPHYFQISQTVLDPATLERELTPLRKVRDNHPKTLLTLDRMGLGDYDGIRHANVIDWLLEDNQ